MKSLSHVRLFVTPWTVAHQAPPSMEFSRQEYWSGLPFPSPGNLPDPGMEPRSPSLGADALPSEPPGNPTWLKGGIKNKINQSCQKQSKPNRTQRRENNSVRTLQNAGPSAASLGRGSCSACRSSTRGTTDR